MRQRSSVYDRDGDDDVRDVARAMIRAFGANAPSILRMRVANHRRHGSTSDAAYWGEVAAAVEAILSGYRRADDMAMHDRRSHGATS